MLKTRLSFLSKVLSLFLLVGLSLACFQLASYARGSDQSKEVSSWIPIFPLAEGHQLNNLDVRIHELQNALEFMVWPREREKIFRLLTNQLRAKQNLAPYTNRDTLLYLAIAEAANFSNREKLWSLQRALTFNTWTEKSRYSLLHYCFDFQSILNDDLRQRCNKLLVRLSPKQNIEFYAKQIDVDKESLLRALESLGWNLADQIK